MRSNLFLRGLALLLVFGFMGVACGSADDNESADTTPQEDTVAEADMGEDQSGQVQPPRCEGSRAIYPEDGQMVEEECPPDGYCNFGQCTPSAFILPDDAGPHDDIIEWWYYTGHVTDGEQEFGFEIALFQQRMEDLMGTEAPEGEEFGLMCHVALFEKNTPQHVYTQEISTKTREWSSSPVVLDTMGCTLEMSGDGHDHIRGVIADGKEGKGLPGEWYFDLEMDTTKPVIHHGGDGVIPMAFGGDSYYYSFTRMDAQGTVSTPTHGEMEVTGQAWMDHQWGDFQTMDFKGWDWWSMQFEDGWEIMLFLFRDWNDVVVVKAGSLVDPEGNVTHLDGLNSFEIESLRTWESQETDGVYPLDWDITIDEMDWQLKIRTQYDPQEVPNFAKNYWEGAVEITGIRDGNDELKGVGYVELTGYATDIMGPVD